MPAVPPPRHAPSRGGRAVREGLVGLALSTAGLLALALLLAYAGDALGQNVWPVAALAAGAVVALAAGAPRRITRARVRGATLGVVVALVAVYAVVATTWT